ncbi:ABC transporter substrate-binding protein [Thermococcus barophilus]|uniref:Dipeptide-binding ABC transporter periplasmic substrate-binding component n=1 Tax=Thermococcus barophilus (strain DSM 11836 / MP) TaxID=391623 RepID=F0LIP0_THEBM|nr:ABC transporter substrate-binding protein [Thermococcus barophilus]ADT84492.1 dipeptide-binding ABC transporter periplasmic substrate-binding component [Thermococcus barophilus MP]
MKKALSALFLIAILGFAVVASGCIGGEKTTTPTSTQATTQTTTQTSTASSPTKTTTQTQAPKPKGITPAILELDKVAVIETDKSVIVVGPKGENPTVSLPSGKKVIRVSYVVDEANTPDIKKLMEEGQGFGAIDPAFFRNTNVDALVIAARRQTDPAIRTELFKALYILGNYYVPEVIIGQNRQLRVYWSWVKGRYYHPTLPERYDLLWEDPNAPSVSIGIGEYKNDAETYVIGTIGWPESFDPAWTYETFGWEIWHEIGDTLVTYWKDETEEVSPDLAVAWAHNEDGTEWYFVIRGGVKAYDPWNDKTYPIDATDVAFTFWRVQRLGHSVSWMVSEFMDVNKSQALTEQDFENILKSEKLIAEYKGKTVEVKSLDDLLKLFGYSGKTAGVFKLVLPHPYAPVLNILADPFLSVVPMEYLLGDKYEEALKASDNGKNPSAWAKYVQEGEQDPTHQLMHKKPVGTGPYYVKEYQENSYIVLELNPYYWNKDIWNNIKPLHKRVIYVINNDAVSRIQLFQTGTVDTVATPPERINDVKGLKLDGFESIVQTDLLQPILTFIVFNTYKEPFNNVKVRQALAYAIPYDQIAQTVYSGLLERNWGPIPKPWPGYTEQGIIKYDYNLAKAQQLLKESGIDPTKYKIELIYNAGNSAREKIMTLLQNVWSQLGFQVTVASYEWPVYLGKVSKGDFDVYVVGWVPDYLDSDNWVGPFLYGATKFKELNVEVSG